MIMNVIRTLVKDATHIHRTAHVQQEPTASLNAKGARRTDATRSSVEMVPAMVSRTPTHAAWIVAAPSTLPVR